MIEIVPVTLTGRHARLEPLSSAHLDALWDAHGVSDSVETSVTRWFPVPMARREALGAFIEEAQTALAAGAALPFATIDIATGKPVGSTRFANADKTHRRVEIGWTWLGRQWQRSALNTEAKLLMLTHAFEHWRCIRVEFKTDSLNQPSRTALARLGAVEEGTFRNHMVIPDVDGSGGRYRHSVYFSITDGEWPDVKARLQGRLARG